MVDEELVVLEDHVGGRVLFLDRPHELPQLPATLSHPPDIRLSEFPFNFLSCVYCLLFSVYSNTTYYTNVDRQFSN